MFFSKKYSSCLFIVLLSTSCALSMIPKSIAIFAHGLGGNASHSQAYRNLIGCPIVGENGPEWNGVIYGSAAQRSCLAQEADIAIVAKQIAERVQNNIMLLGVSKGAATMLNTVGWLAVNNPSALTNVRAVILDSPFSTPESVAAKVAGQFVEESLGTTSAHCIESSMNWSSSRPIIRMLTTQAYPNYQPNGITPIKSVTTLWNTVDKNMVIVFIHSKQDKLISINDSRLLYLELKKLGLVNLYLIEAEAGEHGNVCWGLNRKYIFRTLCLIYLRHNLPIPQLSSTDSQALHLFYEQQGQRELEKIQPSVKEIDERLHPSWLSSSCIS
jgi:hypothetical protein